MSAKIMLTALQIRYPQSKHTVIFQKWDKFGLFDGDVTDILSHNPRTVYILDIGSDANVINQALKILDKNINVAIFDNHPPEGSKNADYIDYLSILAKTRDHYPFPVKEAYPYPYFMYDAAHNTCTTGVVFEYVSQFMGLTKEQLESMEIWAIMGLRGDVAYDAARGYDRGAALYNTLIVKRPYLEGLLQSTEQGDDFDKSLLEFFVQLFHVPRRIIFDDAPPLCMKALDELAQIEDWLTFYKDVNVGLVTYLVKKKANNNVLMEYWPVDPEEKPNLVKVIELYYEWRSGFREFFDAGVTLFYPAFTVAIVNSNWNLGSALANVKSSRTKKPSFVVNIITRKRKGITKEDVLQGKPLDIYDVHISGRSSEDSKLHIGEVFRTCDPDIMFGGGLKMAGSANVRYPFIEPSQINAETLTNELVRAANKALYSTKGQKESE